ncbi:RHS repeat-associated core domain-containing protein [Corynebacterium sp. MSK041]|uniref:RHS repeat-associated core domain-containing protein n=1 Tax=Corynebacterium sp. MSK041 TaxID=3050194 RepID=UPI002550042E|nr:RHS repeat-associated core domain-containing protein [Corynebacterium sp. MSK041]MDK8795048.1 RHS repeat-associated core domain-containing protein [Corynebacterium sp. MSK041]
MNDPASGELCGQIVLSAKVGQSEHQQLLVKAKFEFVVTDLARSPQEIVDPETGSVSGVANQTLYGQRTWQGHTSSPLLYAGQYFDTESGWAYNRYRYYHPHAGIYNAQDPLGVAPRLASAQGYVDHAAHWFDYLGLHSAHDALPGPHPIYEGRNAKGQFTGTNPDARYGTNVHKRYSGVMEANGFTVDRQLPGSKGKFRPDAHTANEQGFITEVREFKPDTPSGRAKGKAQLAKYEQYAESYNRGIAEQYGATPPTVQYVLDFYKP